MAAGTMSLKPANRICSLLPSATEIVGRLGLADRLVCVTHECDVAPNAPTLEDLIESGKVSRVTSSAINPAVFTQTRIDDMVTASLGTGDGLYGIDNAAVAKARPDLIITQQLCTVCAPSGTHVAAAMEAVAASLQNTPLDDQPSAGTTTSSAGSSASSSSSSKSSPSPLPSLPAAPAVSATPDFAAPAAPGMPNVLSLEPESLLDVADSCVAIAQACGEGRRGRALRSEFLDQLQAISDAISCPDGEELPVPEREVFILEWLDPPFDAGHWVPEIQQISMGRFQATSCAGAAAEAAVPMPGGFQAGGLQATGPACTWSATKSKRTTWNSIAATDPAILVVSCCGFDYARNVADARMTLARHPVACTLRAVREGRVFAVDGNRYLARPGPSLAQGTAAVAASIWHDDPKRLRALEATGLVPERGVMWGQVDVQPDMVRTLGMVGMVCGIGDVEDVPLGGGGGGSGGAGGGGAALRKWADVHAEAAARGDKFYEDPESQLMVMTEVVHRERGQCCGRACRHCPYMHDRVAMHVRPEMISRAAWLEKPAEGAAAERGSGAASAGVEVLLCGCSQGDVERAVRATEAGRAAVLVVPLDAESRLVHETGMHAVDAREAARSRGVPLLGLPVHGGGPGLQGLVADAAAVLQAVYGSAALSWAVSGSLGESVSDWKTAAGVDVV